MASTKKIEEKTQVINITIDSFDEPPTYERLSSRVKKSFQIS